MLIDDHCLLLFSPIFNPFRLLFNKQTRFTLFDPKTTTKTIFTGTGCHFVSEFFGTGDECLEMNCNPDDGYVSEATKIYE